MDMSDEIREVERNGLKERTLTVSKMRSRAFKRHEMGECDYKLVPERNSSRNFLSNHAQESLQCFSSRFVQKIEDENTIKERNMESVLTISLSLQKEKNAVEK